MYIKLSLSKRIHLFLWFNNPPKQPSWMMSLFCCLVFIHKLCTWWLGQSSDVQSLLHAQFASGQETDCNTQINTIPVTFTMISLPFQAGASIRVGFALLKDAKNQSEPKAPCTNSPVLKPPLQKCHLSALYPAVHHGWTNFSADIYNWGERSTHNLWPTQWCFGQLFSVPKPPDSLWRVIYVQELMKRITTCKC